MTALYGQSYLHWLELGIIRISNEFQVDCLFSQSESGGRTCVDVGCGDT